MASGKKKRRQSNEVTIQDAVLAQNLDYQRPGRAVGITALLSTVAFTAIFMNYPSTKL